MPKISWCGFLTLRPVADDSGNMHSMSGPSPWWTSWWNRVMVRIVRRHRSDGQSSWRKRMSLGVSQSAAKIVRATLAWTRSRARASTALALLCHTGQAYSIIGLTYVMYRWHVSFAGSWWDTWTCRNSPARLRALVRIDSRWAFHLRSVERMTPRCLWVSTMSIFSSSIDRGNCWHAFVARLPSGRTTVLAGEKRPLQDWAHADASDTLVWRLCISCGMLSFEISLWMRASSAYNSVWDFWTADVKSLMNTAKSIGPKWDPWVTPVEIGWDFE